MGMEIIDFHTHPFVDNTDNLCMYKESMKMGIKQTKTYMHTSGISMFCGSVIKKPMNGFETMRTCNRDALLLREIYGEAYLPGFHIHPDYISESMQEIDFAHANGVRLIGELVPYMHGWSDYADAKFSELLDYAAQYNMVISLHTLDLTRMEKMAKAHSCIKFVFAHPGEKEKVLEHIHVLKKCANVSLDISGTGINRYGLIEFLVNTVGEERILFGSDYPIGDPAMYINSVMRAKISDRQRESIFSKNAKSLLGL